MISIFEDIGRIRSTRKELREFGWTIGIVLVALSGLALWRGKGSFAYLLISGILFASAGTALPQALKPLQKVWMAFAVVIGFVMSRVILTVLFYAVMTPFGLLTKCLGKDILDLRISKERSSYWRERPAGPSAKESYENQY
ncbi:MAG: SxtJ family membrane protein [Candidatus Omnitrophota bacterium]